MSPSCLLRRPYCLERVLVRVPNAWTKRNSSLCRCGGEASFYPSEGNHASHITSGVAIRHGPLDNVVFVRNSRMKGCPQSKLCVFLLGTSGHICLPYQPAPSTAQWQEGRVTTVCIVCTWEGRGLYTFSRYVCVADGSEVTLVGLSIAKEHRAMP